MIALQYSIDRERLDAMRCDAVKATDCARVRTGIGCCYKETGFRCPLNLELEAQHAPIGCFTRCPDTVPMDRVGLARMERIAFSCVNKQKVKRASIAYFGHL